MSYSMVSVVIGTYINQAVNDELESMGIEAEDAGFEVLYSGGANIQPGYCGVEIYSFDECTDALKVSDIKLHPNSNQMAEATKLFNALDPKVKAVAPPLDVYFVFHTS